MKKRILAVSMLLTLAGLSGSLLAADTMKAGSLAANPVIWADVPDPDVIRVGDTFYMVSTTMHLMPGCPVMRSTNLVDWEVIGYVFDKLTDNPRYNFEEGTAYGRGQWATSLRYHDGMFYVLFSPNDAPYRSYIYRAADPAGEWELVSRTDHFHDSSLFFDDDGRVYVYSGGGRINLRELNPDLSGVKEGGMNEYVILPNADETGLHEGSRVVKHNGKYYAFIISWPGGKPRRQLCYRADNITGPYEKMVVLESAFGGFPYAGQGCMVDDKDGNWWAVIFQDRGAVGRVPTLMPVRWTDGWPMLGDESGSIPASLCRMADGAGRGAVVSSDEFDGDALSIDWQWNHCPVDSAWTLSSRPGYLRLHTSRLVSSIFDAPNTISQRMEGPCCSAAVRLDLSGMLDGDVAGFGAFNGDSRLLSVMQKGGERFLVMHTPSVRLDGKDKRIVGVDDREFARVRLDRPEVYLRIDGDFRPGRDMATFYWSTDGDSWTPIGESFKMVYDFRRMFMGSRYAIYNYATANTGGHVDVDWFRYKKVVNDIIDDLGKEGN